MDVNPTRRLAVLVALALVGVNCCAAQDLGVTPQRADGLYQSGETIEWQIEWDGAKPASQADYSIKNGGRTEIDHGMLTLVDGRARLNASLDVPGTLLVEVRVRSADGKEHIARGGAIVAADRIAPSAPRPADFDAFWDAKLKELAAVPVNARLEQADSGKPGVDYWKITLDGIRGTQIHGQLARPARAQSQRQRSCPRC